MLSYAVYKTVHYLGIFTLVTALAASLARSGAAADQPDPWKGRLAAAHGVGLFLVLLGGFGMLARLGLSVTGWVGAKLVIWALLGALVALRRKPAVAAWGVVAVPVLAFLAGWIAYTKPF